MKKKARIRKKRAVKKNTLRLKVKSMIVTGPNYNDADAEMHRLAANEGNFMTNISIIMHNQVVLNEKLSRIMDALNIKY